MQFVEEFKEFQELQYNQNSLNILREIGDAQASLRFTLADPTVDLEALSLSLSLCSHAHATNERQSIQQATVLPHARNEDGFEYFYFPKARR